MKQNSFSMEEEYISLLFNEELLEDDKELLAYPISYHSKIELYYNNPNIVFKVKFGETNTTYTMDYNKLVSDIITQFVDVIIFVSFH